MLNVFPLPAKAISFTINTPLDPNLTVWGLVINGLNMVIPLSAIVATVFIVYGGFNYILSAGDPGKVKSAQAIITNAAIGLAIIASAFVIKSLVTTLLGV